MTTAINKGSVRLSVAWNVNESSLFKGAGMLKDTKNWSKMMDYLEHLA